MSDVIHTEGFPKGWKVQERDKEEAILCAAHWNFGSTAICRKPRLMDIDKWIPYAREFALSVDGDFAKRIEALEAERDRLRKAAQAMVDFHNLPPEAKRPDVFNLRIMALATALNNEGDG